MLAALSILVGCGDPARDIDELAVQGSIPAGSAPAPRGELAIDPDLRLVYAAGGMGQADMFRIDISDPRAGTR